MIFNLVHLGAHIAVHSTLYNCWLLSKCQVKNSHIYSTKKAYLSLVQRRTKILIFGLTSLKIDLRSTRYLAFLSLGLKLLLNTFQVSVIAF